MLIVLFGVCLLVLFGVCLLCFAACAVLTQRELGDDCDQDDA